MLAFGHTGLTLGLAVLLAGLTATSHSSRSKEVRADVLSSPSPWAAAETNYGETHKLSWIQSLAHYADLRLLLVGSLLPDIIDKPVGQFFFRETFSNGRIFSHPSSFLPSLLFLGSTSTVVVAEHGFYSCLLALSHISSLTRCGALLTLCCGRFTALSSTRLM
jgi:hypothetical protein